MKRYKIGIAGGGQVTREVHLPNLRRMEREALVCVVGVADPDERGRVGGFADLASLLRAELDGVIVASPTGLHAEHASAVLRAGLALYLEKPLAHSLEEAEKLCKLDHGRASMALNYRFHPLHERLFAAWRGKVQRVSSEFSIAPRELSAWRKKRGEGGGVLLDLAVHHVDLALRLFQREVVRVEKRVRSLRHDDDEAEIEIEFDGGGSYRGKFSYQGTERDSFRIEEPLAIEVDRYAPWRFPLWPVGDWWRYQMGRRSAPWKEEAFGKSLRAWVAALGGEAEFPAPLVEGLRVQRTLEWR